ncbi:MAG: outer membrane beta-barrel protein [Prevotellaceae bacterium]|nr:outer membrane beta-barrel protein [Prevotellaceae bacterium]
MKHHLSFIVICVLVSIAKISAQEMTFSFKNTPLSEALSAIRDAQSEYAIHFINNDLERLRISASIKNLSVVSAVNKICDGQPVKVKVKGKEIFVQYKAKETKQMMLLNGEIYDSRTHTHLVGAHVYLLSSDSTVIDSTIAERTIVNGDKVTRDSQFHLRVPKKQESYILKVTHPGYDIGYFDYVINDLHRREFVRTIPPLYLIDLGRILKEVTVTASKVKFYYRGDTIVYNASVFQLAEGSMLDALVKQLPGVELKSDGRIMHNGKFVASLLLNGKEFFRGDNKVMLNNLPAYTVKEIAVYDKQTEKAKFLGIDDENEKEYVMDVRLKKKYSIGLLANMEAAGGTDDRDLARLFAVRFSDHSRFAIYANINNLNNGDNPTDNSMWESDAMSKGQQTMRKVGIDYNVEDRNQKWKADGNAQIAHSDNDLQTNTNRVNFLPSGDTHERSKNVAKDHYMELKTSHSLLVNMKDVQLTVRPDIGYRKTDNRSGFTLSAFNADDSLILRSNQQGIMRGHELWTGLSASSTIKFKKSDDYITLSASARYNDKDDDRFNRQSIQSSSPLFADQYFKNHPNKSWNYEGSVMYKYLIKQGMSLETTYTFRHTDTHREQSLYLLDRLDNRDSLGVLPSVADYERTMDMANSYNSHQTDNAHTISPNLWWSPKLGNGKISLGLWLPFTQLNQHLHYQRGDVDTTIVRHTLLFHPSNSYAEWNSNDRKYKIFFAYRINATAPQLSNFVDIRDATDPLNVHLGNSNLRNTYTHSVQLGGVKNISEKQIYQRASYTYRNVHNALSMSYLYDDQTGVRTYRPCNVNGNWRHEGYYALILPLDHKRRFQAMVRPAFVYEHNVDMTGTKVAERNIVNSFTMTGEASLEYNINNNRIALYTVNDWRHISSQRVDFQNTNASNHKTTLSIDLQLPLKFRLNSSMTNFLRRGYAYDELNTSEWCWNATLSRSFMAGQLTMMLHGYDLLNQLSNVTQTIDAQGRIETSTNTLHRYILLHLSYKLHKAPKKK